MPTNSVQKRLVIDVMIEDRQQMVIRCKLRQPSLKEQIVLPRTKLMCDQELKLPDLEGASRNYQSA